MLQYPDSIPDAETKRITWEAIRNAGKNGVIIEKTICAETNKLVNAYLNLPVINYVLAISISVHNMLSTIPIKETKLKGVKIAITKGLPVRYKKEISNTFEEARNYIIGDYPKNYLSVLALSISFGRSQLQLLTEKL